ncbi:hypothetical protein Amn_21190 [Aminobacter sp. Y103A]|nr:hypothetical protein Amn_21190 [Aminobacter sp. SS-2016]
MLEVFGAARRMFPLDTSGMRLAYATASEASKAGPSVNSDDAAKVMDIEKSDDEGAAVRGPRTETQRRSENDTSGIRRRARETHTRHQLV